MQPRRPRNQTQDTLFFYKCARAFRAPSVPTVVAFVIFGAFAGSGCAHPQAKTATAATDVPLDVPAPPPRATEPITADALPAVGPPLNEPAPTNAARPPRPSAPTPAAPATRADTPRNDVPTGDASRPADDASGKPPVPAATLQTTPAQQEPEVEARIRSVLARATSDLNRVDYGRLSTTLKAQYDLAKRFVSQAEDNIRSRNFVYAGTLADKAAELAAQLSGR